MPLILGDYSINKINGPLTMNCLSSSPYIKDFYIILFGDRHNRIGSTQCKDPDCYELSDEFVDVLADVATKHKDDLRIEFYFETPLKLTDNDVDYEETKENIYHSRRRLISQHVQLDDRKAYLQGKSIIQQELDREDRENSHMIDMIKMFKPCIDKLSTRTYQELCAYKMICPC